MRRYSLPPERRAHIHQPNVKAADMDSQKRIISTMGGSIAMNCSICKDEIEGEGYSTQPFFKDENKKCCEVCSRIFVGPAKRNYKDIGEE